MNRSYSQPPKTNSDMVNRAIETGMICDPQVRDFCEYLRDDGMRSGALDMDVSMFDFLMEAALQKEFMA